LVSDPSGAAGLNGILKAGTRAHPQGFISCGEDASAFDVSDAPVYDPAMSNPGPVTPDEDKKYDVGDEVQRLEHAAPSGVKTLEERQAQLKAALEVDPGITTWSAAAFYVSGVPQRDRRSSS
jgi:hypothetical protein